MIAVIAETFHVLPSVAARDLDEDPEYLSLQVLPLLGYAQAFRAFKNAKGDDAQLKAWEGDKMMERVQDNTFALHKARVKRNAPVRPGVKGL